MTAAPPTLPDRVTNAAANGAAVKLLTPEDLLAMPDGDRYELIDGIPVEKEMSFNAAALAFDLGLVLANFVKLHRLGRMFGADAGYACFPERPGMYRKPDVSFIARDRLPHPLPDHYPTIAPDLVIEAISPGNSFNEIEEKVALYRSAGVKLIWIVSPKSRTILIRRLDGTASEVGPDGTLSGEGVVPGFTLKIAELFEE